MADQCIVCLEDLDHAPNLDEVDPRSVIAENGHLDGTKSPKPQPSTSDEQQLIAVIETCQHVLHDACLKEWTQKANSCPICRTQFNKVEVRETTTGPPLYTYEVEDKKQIAEFDPLAWIQEQDQHEVIDTPCPICGTQEDEDQLLLCDSCDAPYHTYCVGLDRVPVGNWFCMECSHEEGDRRNAADNPPAVPVRRERTLAQQRQNRSRRRVRANAWEGAWNQIATRVHDATGLDLDYDGQEELNDYRQAHSAQLRTEAQEREWREWQQRVAIASRQGAGRVFINATRPVVQPHVLPEPRQESETERRAWATYERVRREGTPGASSSRKRKATESPMEPQPQEPERKLKRPRTRRVREREQPESASEAPAETSAPNCRSTPRVSATPRRSPRQDAPATEEQPSFLASLLKEVEQSAKVDSHGDGDGDVTRTSVTSPVPEFASPILSPIASGYSSPRLLSLTPPPRRSGSPVQTPISSYVQPIYPPVNPADFSPNRPRRERAGSRPSTPPPTMQMASHIRHPQPQRPQIALSEYQMSLPPSSTMKHMNEQELIRHKGEIKDWVKKAIDIHHRNHLTDNQYTDVNCRVSRKLYNIIPNVAMLSEEDKHKWQNRTSGEVDKAVEFLGYGRSHGLGAASGSNGVTA